MTDPLCWGGRWASVQAWVTSHLRLGGNDLGQELCGQAPPNPKCLSLLISSVAPMALPTWGPVIPQCLMEQLAYRALRSTVTIYPLEVLGGSMEVWEQPFLVLNAWRNSGSVSLVECSCKWLVTRRDSSEGHSGRWRRKDGLRIYGQMWRGGNKPNTWGWWMGDKKNQKPQRKREMPLQLAERTSWAAISHSRCPAVATQ